MNRDVWMWLIGFAAAAELCASHKRLRSACYVLLLILPALGSSSLALHAQQAKAPELFYEGQPVAAAELVGRPPVDIEPYRSLVLQKAGEPYSSQKIRDTVTAMERMGHFSKVDVEVTPSASGLRVLLVLEPAFYIGAIAFPGAEATFSYSRLLEVVNYPAQEPYDETRVKAAEPALVRYFSNNGYFAAQVRSETNLDVAHHVANLVFHVTLNQRAKLGKVEVAGPPPREAAKLKAALHSWSARLKGASLSSGKPYDADRIRAAADLLSKRLSSDNRLASQVRRQRPNYHPETNRADLSFQVTLGPTVEVRTSGAGVSKGQLRKLVPIYEENAVDQDLVQEGRRHLVSYLQKKGFFDVNVAAQVENEPSQVSVIYTITKGNKHRVEDVEVSDHSYFTEAELSKQVMIKKASLLSRGQFSDELVNRSVKNLTAFYQNAGFADAKVKAEIIDHEPKLYVTFKVVEAEQTLVDSFRIEGNKTQSIDILAPDGLRLKPGQPYSQALLKEDRNQILANYLNLGYATAKLQSTAVPRPDNPHRVAVTYVIDEGPQTRISQTTYLGAQHTRKSFIERNAKLKPGDPLSEGKLLEAETKLYNLGDFDWAEVSPLKPITDQTEEEVVVKVHESKRNSLGFGIGFQSTPRSGSLSSGVVSLPGLPTVGLPRGFTIIQKNIINPLGSIDYTRSNLFGRGEMESISALVSSLAQKANLTYSIPQFRGLDWNALWSFSGERNSQNPLFTARSALGSWQVEKVLDAAKSERLQLRYTFQRTALSNLLIQNFISPDDLSIQSSFPSISFIRDTRDKPLDAHKGFFQTVDLRVTPKAFGSTDSYIRILGQMSYHRELAPWMVWANNVRLGIVKSFGGSHVPFSEQFFSGGADSLRGFPLNGAGPQGTAILCTKENDPSTCTAKVSVPEGGRQLFIFNSEARFPIPISMGPVKGLGGVIFYDGGNVYKSIGFGRFWSDYSNTVGFGLRYQTPVGPIRIDIGHNLSPAPGLKATQIFVTMGQSF